MLLDDQPQRVAATFERFLCVRPGNVPEHGIGDAPECGRDVGYGRLPAFLRQVHQVDVHRQAGKVTDEQVDRRASFEREAFFLRYQRQDAHQ